MPVRPDSSSTVEPVNQMNARIASHIAIIQSCWHRDIVDRGRESVVTQLKKFGYDRSQIDLFEVPGAFEIPLHAKRLAETGKYRAIIACGLVVDGGIYRHEFVAQAVIDGLMRVQLDTNVPVFSMVLTPHHFHEHEQHQRYFLEHFVTKGEEAATACAQTLQSLEKIHGGADVSVRAVKAAATA